MTPEERKAAAAVMASDGPWEYRNRNTKPWFALMCEPNWNWQENEYRVKPKPIVRYVNVYDLPNRNRTRAEADNEAKAPRLACVRVEFLPGQFDE